MRRVIPPDGGGMTAPTIIVGAGLTGATVARALADAGRAVVVLDKGRGPGGRLSSRRRDGLVWSHGAPWLEPRGEAFRAAVEGWIAAGVAARAEPRVARLTGGALVPEAHGPVVRGVPGSSAIVAALLDGLDVRYGAEVRRLARTVDGVQAFTADGTAVARGRDVVVTAPASQAHALLAGLAGDAEIEAARVALAAVEVDPVWAVLVRWPDAPAADLLLDVGPIARAVRHGSDAWTLHADLAWTARHLEDPPEVVAAAIAGAATSVGPTPLEAVAHRWRYARVRTPVGRPVWVADRVVVAGDALLGADAEHAWTSGRAAAEALG
jgi:predicted NAD/FAD-dependent oxidoreductase